MVSLVVCQEFNSGVGKYSQQGSGMALKEASDAFIFSNISNSLEQTRPATCAQRVRISSRNTG